MMDEIIIDGDAIQLKGSADGTGAECKKCNEESNFNKKVRRKQAPLNGNVTEKNKPNFKIIAQVLKNLYEQGVRAK